MCQDHDTSQIHSLAQNICWHLRKWHMKETLLHVHCLNELHRQQSQRPGHPNHVSHIQIDSAHSLLHRHVS